MHKIKLVKTAFKLVNLKARQERRFNDAGLLESYKRAFKTFELRGRVVRGFENR